MMATIKIKITAGTSIEEAFTEAARISEVLGVFVEFKFNGVTCTATADGSAEKGAKEYDACLSFSDGRSAWN